MSAPGSAFEHWRKLGEGWSPLFSEPLIELALGHLEPALAVGRTVLDLGAGGGHVAAVFHARGAHAVALDLDRGALLNGRVRHPGPARVGGDQARLPLRSGSLDALFSFSTLQYSDDRSVVLAECRRVLKPGGRVAIVENLEGNPFARIARWLRRVSGTPQPSFLAPRHHLRWRERAIYERHFRDVTFAVFHGLTPIVHAWGSLDRAPVAGAGDTGWRALFHLLRRWDRPLLRRWPGAAWCVVIRGVR
jgi:ubiquinone/menaquinone biosynthesis C-methylase UbiE